MKIVMRDDDDYRSADVTDAYGEPFVIRRHENPMIGWVVRDSRGRFVSEHASLGEAERSM